ncbi:MAG: hypothetical protein H0V90_07775 [Blastocatellia bacterium]|nr:hypothetical protein [Blastocatellia bacterium]
MKRIKYRPFCILAFLITLNIAAFGQKKFEGYSLILEADNSSACAIRFLPAENDGRSVQVFLAGTNQQTPATGLTGCDNAVVQGNRASINEYAKWCFQGQENLYDIKLSNGTTYLWYPLDKNAGTYNVEDFRPVMRTSGSAPQYVFSTPADYTATIRNALAFIASRQGGTLYFPDGDYIVGTTDGNTRDPRYEAITLPWGTNIVGASSNYSIPTTNLPMRKSATRIRLRHPNQTIFRIGGCTNEVTVRSIELLGNSALFGEAPRNSTGNYGIEALGKWSIDPVTKERTANQSQFFRFENVVFQNLDTGIIVRNANWANCDNATQMCNQWQFDNVRVDHSFFINNKTGIFIDTFNTDWKITNSQFNYLEAIAPGIGIHIRRGAAILIDQTFGGGYNEDTLRGGTFLYIDSVGSITVLSSSSERSRRSIYTAAASSATSQMMTVIGSVFGDKIELNGRMNYISTGNHYFAKTIQAEPNVTITSTGDRFCYDPLTFGGYCKDAAGKPVSQPGFDRGRVMFRTGRLPEGAGENRIGRQPNFFGYDVEIGDGFLQFDPNISFRDIIAFTTPGEGGPRVKDGAFVYCKDCRKNTSGICTQGQPGTDGAFAKRINGQWRCD